MRSPALIALLLAAPLAGCAAGERGLVSPHQPLVSAMGATVPGCPDWSDKTLPMSEGQSSNYGCATASNLAAMIADPNDLVRGRSDGTSDAARTARTMKTWRDTGQTGGQGLQKVSSKGN